MVKEEGEEKARGINITNKDGQRGGRSGEERKEGQTEEPRIK